MGKSEPSGTGTQLLSCAGSWVEEKGMDEGGGGEEEDDMGDDFNTRPARPAHVTATATATAVRGMSQDHRPGMQRGVRLQSMVSGICTHRVQVAVEGAVRVGDARAHARANLFPLRSAAAHARGDSPQSAPAALHLPPPLRLRCG